MKVKITYSGGALQGMLNVPASKSISNRLLIIGALSGSGRLENLSDSDDTAVMQRALNSDDSLKDIGHAGTSMRFLTAFYATKPGAVTLTGSRRMKQRPIGPLVNALRALGADIEYTGNEGFPPLEIKGKRLNGGSVEIDGGVSSQFISALLMIAPVLRDGLDLELTGEVVSWSYIHMTLELMKQAGATYRIEGTRIMVSPGGYIPGNAVVESDWSAAAFWYAIAGLSGEKITLSHFFDESLQGDAVVREIFHQLGEDSSLHQGQILLGRAEAAAKSEHPVHKDGAPFEFDFLLCPDLVQPLAVYCCMQEIPFRFTGTRTLRIKETDRIAALQAELLKFGYILRSDKAGTFLAWDGAFSAPEEAPVISTYHDHRMAMAFAQVAIKRGSVIIDDPMVVSKSYPTFWRHLESLGFQINEI